MRTTMLTLLALIGCGSSATGGGSDDTGSTGEPPDASSSSSSSEGTGWQTTSDTTDGAEDSGDGESGSSSSGGGEEGCSAGNPAAIGDTSPCTRAVFPAEAFWSPDGGEGRIIDVTAPPFNAVGDGVTDDTAALRAAYDFLMDEIDRVGWDGFRIASTEVSYVLYLPDGRYRVTDTIIYDGEDRLHPVGVAEALARVRIMGESREGTVVALDPELPAFGEGQPPRPVISFGNLDFNNVPGDNSLRNLTVRIGAGNPSAIGVKFGGANSSDVQNVAILSDDPEGAGAIGLDDRIGTVLSYQRDIIVDGFDVGVRMLPYHFTRPTLEHITLRNQRVTGMEFVDGTGTVRALRAENEVPAVRLTGAGSHAVLVDAELSGGGSDVAAIELDAGHLFVRNVSVAGYGTSIVTPNDNVTGDVGEWVSDPVVSFDGTPTSSLALPVEEVPRFDDVDPSLWALPDAPGDASADASRAVQAAMDAGQPVVAFVGHEYRFDDTIEIPCGVQQVQLLFTTISGDASPKFRVLGPCEEPLLVADGTVLAGINVEHAGQRPLVMTRINTSAFPYRNAVAGPGPTVFMNMVTGVKVQQPFHDQTAYLRVFNGESTGGQLRCEAATCWVLGFKTEKSATAMQAVDGARLEVLGGIFNQYTPEANVDWSTTTAVIGEDAELSIVAATNGPNDPNVGFEVLVRDTQGGQTHDIAWEALPQRQGRPHNEIIPLYRGP